MRKHFFAMAQGCLKGVGEYLHGFWQSFGYAPSPEEYNLAYLFPLEDTAEEEKGGEASQKTAADILLQTVLQKLSRFGPELHQKSAGGELFEELNEKEQNWMYRIYQELNRLPYRTGIRFRFSMGMERRAQITAIQRKYWRLRMCIPIFTSGITCSHQRPMR